MKIRKAGCAFVAEIKPLLADSRGARACHALTCGFAALISDREASCRSQCQAETQLSIAGPAPIRRHCSTISAPAPTTF